MPNTEKRARQLSCLYYNQGLERARVRDLTGAEAKLRQSLQLNKRNTQARNLLGLVYYETGEVVSALQEWLISQSLQSRDNLASEYLVRVQHDQSGFRLMNEGVRAYNKALRNCWEGNEDIAAIQLRRVVSRQPKLIRAAQLLALIEIKEGKLGQAKRVLSRAQQTDRTNPVTLRYLQEIEDQIKASSRGKRADKADEEAEAAQQEQPAVQKARFRETSAFSALINILIGLALGILALAFLVVPVVRRNINESTNARIVDYTTTIAEQKDHVATLQTQIDESNAVVAQAREQVESVQTELGSYQSLIKAYDYMQKDDYMKAGDEILKIEPTTLSDDTITIYNDISGVITERAYDEFELAGDEAYYVKDWTAAITYFEKAIAIRMDDPDLLNLLAKACVNADQKEKGIEYFQMIMDNFPNTQRASSAEYEITVLGGTPKYSEEEGADGGETGGSAEEETQEVYEEPQEEYTEPEYTEEYTEPEYTEEYSEETYEE